MSAPVRPKDAKGRFVALTCPDSNCGGTLVREGAGVWRCNGLTHAGETDPLVACPHLHLDGTAAGPTRVAVAAFALVLAFVCCVGLAALSVTGSDKPRSWFDPRYGYVDPTYCPPNPTECD